MYFFKSLALFFCLTFLGHTTYAQSLNALKVESIFSKAADDKTLLMTMSYPIKSKQKSKKIYLYLNWIPATLYSISGNIIGCQARYNVLNHWMEIHVDDSARRLNSKAITGIALNDDLFIPLLPKSEKDIQEAEYYEVLSVGAFALIRKYEVTLSSAIGGGLYPTIGQESEYKLSNKLYICKNKDKAERLKKGKKNILKIFQKREKEISDFAKKNNHGFKKERDLKLLFDEYNRLEKVAAQ